MTRKSPPHTGPKRFPNLLGPHTAPNGATDEWLTPPWVVEGLGPFDLDPCCPPNMPWRTARVMLTPADDGLAAPWAGRVWLNPPYGRGIGAWMNRMANHGSGTALVFARTGAKWAQDALAAATAVLFLAGRLKFHFPDGTRAGTGAGCDSMLLAYGKADAAALRLLDHKGVFVPLGDVS
jgi:hypothetical protein